MTSEPLAGSSFPIPITERSLIDICDLLGADRFELAGVRVSFVSRRGRAREVRWTGYLGDHLVPCGTGWRITSELGTETVWASVA
ncbi:MAG: hypothetical protein ABWY56_02400 [Propionibacteriaceae bacterium]